jgi:hypothetical protein
MRIWEAAEEARSCAAYHRLDEPARLSLSMVASLQRPLPFPLTEDYNFAPITSLPLTRRYVLFFNEDAMNRSRLLFVACITLSFTISFAVAAFRATAPSVSRVVSYRNPATDCLLPTPV